jgi:hypothetical protein
VDAVVDACADAESGIMMPPATDIIQVHGELGLLLREVALEDIVREMSQLHAAAVRGRLASPSWLPVVVACEDEALYGLCLSDLAHAKGSAEAEALERATDAAARLTPTDRRLRYTHRRDAAGQLFAVQPTLRLRIEHWRSLARGIWDSLGQVLAAAGEGSGREPAPLLIGRIWPCAAPNVLAEFAAAQRTEDLLRFTEAVVRSSEPLHLRISLCCHLLALRRFRLEEPEARADLELLLARIESELYGDYHLDGQSAYRALRSLGWDDNLQVLDM